MIWDIIDSKWHQNVLNPDIFRFDIFSLTNQPDWILNGPAIKILDIRKYAIWFGIVGVLNMDPV